MILNEIKKDFLVKDMSAAIVDKLRERNSLIKHESDCEFLFEIQN